MGLLDGLSDIARVAAPTIIGGVLGGPAGASVGASLGLGYSSARAQEEVNRQNIEIAREQMGFQREMSDTAIRRRMKDLSEAGINPILAAMDQQASTPPGAALPVQNPIAAGASTARDISSIGIESSKLETEVNKLIADTNLSTVDAALRSAMYNVQIELAKKEQLNVRALTEQVKILEAEVVNAKNRQELTETEAGQWLNWVKAFFEAIGLSSGVNIGFRR